MLLHAASYAEGKGDLESFRQLRDSTFDRVQNAIHEGEDAAAIMELLFKGISFGDLPHQGALLIVNAAWHAFLQKQAEFLGWLDAERAALQPMMPTHELAAKNQEVSERMQAMRDQTIELLKLTAEYDESVSRSIRMLADALEV